jgi:uncharacterized protein with GYD domain
MPRYISLLRFTDQGARGIKNSTTRALDFKKAAEKAGVRVEAQYWMFGAYDGLLILSADSPEAALHCLTELSSAGNVRTETMRGFDGTEFAQLTGK